MRRSQPGICAGLLAIALTGHVQAIGRPAGPGRFDSLSRPRAGGVIASAPRPWDRLADADPLRAAWEGFIAKQPGALRVYLDERTGLPALSSGKGIPWTPGPGNDLAFGDPTTIEGLERRAREFLEEHRALLGDWNTSLQLDETASGSTARGNWQIVFRQRVGDRIVENARFNFYVAQGNLVSFGADRLAPVRFHPEPVLGAAEARAALNDYVDDDATRVDVTEPELVLMAIDARKSLTPAVWSGPRGEGLDHVLVWRFRFQVPDEPQLWVAEIDSRNGDVYSFFDATRYENVRGGAYPSATDEDCPSGGCEINGFPMPFADVSIDGGAPQQTDAFGRFSCDGASARTNLEGPFVQIVDSCGPISETVGCGGDLELGIKEGVNCSVDSADSPGNTGASRSAFYHLNRIGQMVRTYLPGNAWLQSQVTANVNLGPGCGAFWNGSINMSGTDLVNCNNLGENPGVLVHEWAHGLDQNDGGGFDNTSEAYADTATVFYNRESCAGRGGNTTLCTGWGDTCLECTGKRDHDFAKRQANTPATPQVFVTNLCPPGGGPCGREVHCEAYPIVESIFDLATRDLPAMGLDANSSWQHAQDLWYETRLGSGGPIYNCALPLSDSCGASSWYQRMRVADDDDGDLSNGTPHAAALYAAFARHNIACGLASDANNQNGSSCPVLGAPLVSTTLDVDGISLDWPEIPGAGSYTVFRSDDSCDRQQVAVATIQARESSFLDAEADLALTVHYRVRADTSNAACHGPVSECVALPAGAHLRKQAHDVIDSGPLANGTEEADPGETVTLPVSLFNVGSETASGVTGRLRSVDPERVRVLSQEASYPDIALKTEAGSDTPHYRLVVDPSAICGRLVDLELDAQAANASETSTRFHIRLGCNPTECADPVPGEVPPSMTVARSGNDLVFDWEPVAGAAGYHLLHDTVADFASNAVAASTSGATTQTLIEAVSSTPEASFFQVRAINICNWEGE